MEYARCFQMAGPLHAVLWGGSLKLFAVLDRVVALSDFQEQVPGDNFPVCDTSKREIIGGFPDQVKYQFILMAILVRITCVLIKGAGPPTFCSHARPNPRPKSNPMGY